jgi:hypothetical protein
VNDNINFETCEHENEEEEEEEGSMFTSFLRSDHAALLFLCLCTHIVLIPSCLGSIQYTPII